MTRIACQQLAPVLGDLAANRKLALAAIREAVDDGADVVVLPELITSGYMFESPPEAADAAIDRDHEVLAEWAQEAARADIVLAGGFCERGDDGRIYNTSLPARCRRRTSVSPNTPMPSATAGPSSTAPLVRLVRRPSPDR